MAALGGLRMGVKRPHSSASGTGGAAGGSGLSAANNPLLYGVRGEISLQVEICDRC